jgi:hypothetical protein
MQMLLVFEPKGLERQAVLARAHRAAGHAAHERQAEANDLLPRTEARDHLERAYQMRPRDEKAKNLLGLAYFKLGDFVRAAEVGQVGAYLLAIPPVTVAMFAANRARTFAEQSR